MWINDNMGNDNMLSIQLGKMKEFVILKRMRANFLFGYFEVIDGNKNTYKFIKMR